MSAAECPQANAVKFLVVFVKQSFPPFILLPNPFLKTLFDFLLLVAGRFCRGRIENVPVLSCVVVVNRGSAEIKRVLQQIEGAAPVGSPFCRIGHAGLGGPSAFDHP